MADPLDELLHQSMPLCRTLGMRAVTGAPGKVAVELDWSAELCTTGGALHGGVIMALADSAGGMCAYLNLPDGAQGTSTIESKTNFLGTVRDGVVTATATPLHVGNTTIVVETDVTRADGKRVAKVIQTQVVLR
jgi:1,4-dihydroxy-2-naphthoyl-CoA hydrolase